MGQKRVDFPLRRVDVNGLLRPRRGRDVITEHEIAYGQVSKERVESLGVKREGLVQRLNRLCRLAKVVVDDCEVVAQPWRALA